LVSNLHFRQLEGPPIEGVGQLVGNEYLLGGCACVGVVFEVDPIRKESARLNEASSSLTGEDDLLVRVSGVDGNTYLGGLSLRIQVVPYRAPIYLRI
jgi:hypothetical protein